MTVFKKPQNDLTLRTSFAAVNPGESIFALIDVSHEGWISREDWDSAVEKVNNNLPPGAEPIDGDEMWQILDQNGDGRLSHWEWNALGSVMCR